MNDSVQKIRNPDLIQAIDQAIHAEGKIHEFYLKYLEQFIDPGSKKVLKSLAQIEQNHFHLLKRLKESINREWDETECRKMTEFIRNTSIDFINLDPILSDQDDILDVLGKAIEAESVAFELYLSLAERIPYPAGREFFSELAEEELRHRQILSREFYLLSQTL